MKPITILITDDHTLIRQTWSFVLNSTPGLKVIAECGSAEEAIEKAKSLHPDIVIMDINLPGMNGIEATKQLRKFSPGSKILGISHHNQPVYAREMMHMGASGYITKNSPKEEMIKAIQEIYAGKRYICDEIKNTLGEQLAENGQNKIGVKCLSGREIEIIGKVKNGYSSKEIAALLSISVKTVEVHRYNILKKLKLKNSAALVNFVNHQPELNISSGISI
jgi:DNA-binding NarL/FixJ family response regulator